MCHVILLLPLLALPIFWFAPLSIAVPAYAAVLILSGWIYLLAIRAMHRPVQTGLEALLHSRGEVLAKADGLFRVRVHSEVWNAESEDTLRPGDSVEVVAIEELRLRVRRIGETGGDPARGIICQNSCFWRGEDHVRLRRSMNDTGFHIGRKAWRRHPNSGDQARDHWRRRSR
jgi:membrane protein implicated in regulation of membrane protease activity